MCCNDTHIIQFDFSGIVNIFIFVQLLLISGVWLNRYSSRCTLIGPR